MTRLEITTACMVILAAFVCSAYGKNSALPKASVSVGLPATCQTCQPGFVSRPIEPNPDSSVAGDTEIIVVGGFRYRLLAPNVEVDDPAVRCQFQDLPLPAEYKIASVSASSTVVVLFFPCNI